MLADSLRRVARARRASPLRDIRVRNRVYPLAMAATQYFPAFLSAVSIVASGSSRDSGASSRGTAP